MNMQDTMALVARWYPGHRVDVVEGQPLPLYGRTQFVRVYNAAGLRINAFFVPEKVPSEHWWEDD